MTPGDLAGITARAERRLRSDMGQLAPFLAPRLSSWIDDLLEGRSLAAGFLAPTAFPVVGIAWWAEEAVGSVDPERQEDLAASSMAGYLFIRLIDNLMDGDGPGDVGLLPGLGFFSTVFVRPYRRWFPGSHPFWPYLEDVWVGAADLTARDAAFSHVDLERFHTVSARKTAAARIPVAATFHLHGRVDRLEEWEGFLDSFGRFHQLHNDLLSWRRDVATGTATYLLSMAGEGRSDDAVAEWLLAEGLESTFATLQSTMADLVAIASSLGSPGLVRYVDRRRERLDDDARAAAAGAAAWRELPRPMGEMGGRGEGRSGQPGPGRI